MRYFLLLLNIKYQQFISQTFLGHHLPTGITAIMSNVEFFVILVLLLLLFLLLYTVMIML